MGEYAQVVRRELLEQFSKKIVKLYKTELSMKN